MDNLDSRITLAKADTDSLNALVSDYLPFIKAEIAKVSAEGLEYDDKLSLGMLVFMNCVRQYQQNRGGFISYASTCIRNRLLDETRKLQSKHQHTIYFRNDLDTDTNAQLDNTLALAQYSQKLEQQSLQEEIAMLSDTLSQHNLSFTDLAHISPKQKRSRRLCTQLAQAVCDNALWYQGFCQTAQLPQKLLSEQFNISPKTIEKHRRYIVALILILSGDYPCIATYIPTLKEDA